MSVGYCEDCGRSVDSDVEDFSFDDGVCLKCIELGSDEE